MQDLEKIAVKLGFRKPTEENIRKGTHFLDDRLVYRNTGHDEFLIFTEEQRFSSLGLYEAVYIPNYFRGNVDGVTDESAIILPSLDKRTRPYAYRILIDNEGRVDRFLELYNIEERETPANVGISGFDSIKRNHPFVHEKSLSEYLGLPRASLENQIRKAIHKERIGEPSLPTILPEKPEIGLKDYIPVLKKAVLAATGVGLLCYGLYNLVTMRKH